MSDTQAQENSAPTHSSGEARIVQIVARCEDGDMAAALDLERSDLEDRVAARMVRVRLVPLVREAKAHEALAHVMRIWLAVEPGSFSDRLLLSSTLVRLGQDEEARGLLAELSDSAPTNVSVAVARMQLDLREGRISDAAAVADRFEQWDNIPARAAHIGMLVLLRAGRAQRALALSAACTDDATAELSAVTAEAHLALGDPVMGARVAQRALASGQDSAALRVQLANAAMTQFEYDRAITHLMAGLEAAPDDVRTLATLGELMLVKRRPKAAHAYLLRALERAPELVHVRALLGRALKDMRDYQAAAQVYADVVKRQPDNGQYRRQAIAVFNMAGNPAKARALFSGLVEERRRALPERFEGGLENLWGHLDKAEIPQVRLDWAWSLRDPAAMMDREEWERRARWGWLADRLVFDWLECNPERAEEAMHRLADLDGGPAELEVAARQDGGLILVSAHIGPLFAGPLALQLLDFESVWLASTPTIKGTAYADSLISTSDQTEAQVVRHAMAALDRGVSVTIAIDGAMNMAAPRVIFEGQEVTYSSFGARLSHRRNARTFFVAPQWRDMRLGFHVAELPRAENGEELDDFSNRWREAYLTQLRLLLAGEPENLRLAGGIWRHIRAPIRA